MSGMRKASAHGSYIKPIMSNALLQNFINSGLASSKNSDNQSKDINLRKTSQS